MKEDTRTIMNIKTLFDGLLSKQERKECKGSYYNVAEILSKKTGKKNKKLAMKAIRKIVAKIYKRGDCEPNIEEYVYLNALNRIV